MKHCIMLLCALALCAPVIPAQEEPLKLDSIPSYNPTLEGYFTETMDSVHSEIKKMTGTSWAGFFDTAMLMKETMQFNLFAGLLIPVTDNIAIPLIGELVSCDSGISYDDSNDHRYSSMSGMGGGGVVFKGKYGLLAGYVGYSFMWESLFEQNDSGSSANKLVYDRTLNKFQWAVFPELNVKRFPLFGAFINVINGFFNMDFLSMNRDNFTPTYKANVVFRDIPIRHIMKITLNTYVRTDWYSIDTKYNLYAGNLALAFPDYFYKRTDALIVGIEGGYRNFFDTQWNKPYYEDGAYMKIALKAGFFGQFPMTFYVESGSKPVFENPTFGFVLNTPPFLIFEKFAVFASFSFDNGMPDDFCFGFSVAVY